MTSKTLANQFRSTFVYGTLNNLDNSSNSIPARAAFQRDVFVGGNLFLGNAGVDASGAFLDSTSNLQYTLNKEIVNFPVTSLRFIKNLTSDIQQQIIDLSNNITNNGGTQSSTFTDLSVNGLLNGLKIKDYGNGTTSFSSGNTDILGSSNTRFGYFTGLLSGYSNAVFGDQSLQNCTGNSNTAIGHNSQNGNTSNSYNTSLGSDSNISGGNSNVAIGCIAQCSNCSNSVALGANTTCTTNNQILLGNSSHTVSIPGSLNINGKISQNIGNQNTAFGLLSFSSNTSGGYNTVFGYNSFTSNTGGAYSTAVGCNALQTSNAFGNTAIGYNAGINVGTGAYNTFLGHNANASQVVSGSTAIGFNATCTESNQIVLGTTSEKIYIPGNQSCGGLISANTLSTSGDMTCNGLLNVNRLSTNGDMACNGLLSVNRLSATGNISFSDSLNNVSATVFGYLSGVTSSIQNQLNSLQNQINALLNNTPPGTVISFAGSASSLSGYLFCDGSSYNSSNQSNLFNAIGYTYGGSNGNFKVPNYKGIFLRGNGSQDVFLRVIAGGGGPIIKQYAAPPLGTTVIDQSTFFETSNYIDSISTTTKTVVTGMSPNLATLSTTSVIGSVNYSTSNNFYNPGNQETHPVHTTVQYFIKY